MPQNNPKSGGRQSAPRKSARGVAKLILDRSFIVMLALIVAGFGGIAIRLGYIMTADADDLRSKAENQQLRDVVTTAGRGNIYDCNMNVLAQSGWSCDRQLGW